MNDRTASYMNLVLRAMYSLRDDGRLPAFANRIHNQAQKEEATLTLANVRRALNFLVDVEHVRKAGDDRYCFPSCVVNNEIDKVYQAK